MKTKSLLFLVTLLLLGSNVRAESYQRWIYWDNAPNHIMTTQEAADILSMLGHGNIVPNKTFQLQSGVSLRVPQPQLLLDFWMLSIKKSDSNVRSIKNACDAILGGEVVMWGNDISVRVKNYYYSSVNNRVQYIDNYSGADISGGIPTLLIKSNPTIKMDCGNPLMTIDYVVKAKPDESNNLIDFYQKNEILRNSEVTFVKKTKFVPASIILLTKQNSKPSFVLKTEEKRVKTWFGKKWPYVVGGVVAIGVSYVVFKPHPSQGVDTRTMPGGIPAKPVVDPLNPTVPVTPGLPSDPRTMPGGVGFNFHGGSGGFALIRF